MRHALLALVFLAAGCSGGGGGGGGNGVSGTEVEPNDDISVATDLGGAGTHEVSGNACNDDQVGIDTFMMTASTAGTISLTLDWNEDDPDDDLGVHFLDADGFGLGSQADEPPASIQTAVTTTGEIVYIEILCYGAFAPVPYEGTVTVP